MADETPSKLKTAAEKKYPGDAVLSKFGTDCFALADSLLRSIGAKTAADFGEVTANADYVWGEAVSLEALQPGDILQFRDHSVSTRTETLGETKWNVTETTGPATRPHHTAIVVEINQDGSVVVIEQNVKPTPKRVTRHPIPALAEGESVRYLSNRVKTTIMVKGTVKAYRPVAKPKGASLLVPDDNTPAGGVRQMGYFFPDGGGPGRAPGPTGVA